MTTSTLLHFDTPIADLGADENGPYWAVRSRNTVSLCEPAGAGSRVLGSWTCDPFPKGGPRLVAGARAILYRKDHLLYAGDKRAGVLSASEFEHFAAAVLGGGLLLRAFAAVDTGHGFVAWDGAGAFTKELQPPGLWAPRASVSADGWLCIVRRTSKGIELETAALADLQLGRWNPRAGLGSVPPGQGRFLGDPAGALEPGGRAHWSACLWQRWRQSGKDWSQQLGPVYVDGKQVATGAVDAVPEFKTSPRIWLPALAWTHRGLALAIQSRMPEGTDPGEVTVGIVMAGRVVPGSETKFAGFQPHLAAAAGRIYIGTSVGLWASA